MKKKNISKNLRKLAEKISEKNIQTENGVAYLEEDVSGEIRKAKKEVKKRKERKKKPGSEAAGLLCVYNLKEVFLESLRLLIACKAYALISTLPSLFALFARVFSAFSVHKLYDRYLSNNLSLLLSLILLPEASVSERHILNILR